MPEDGVTPSGITVCALLNAYCRGGKVDEALALFDSLPQRGLPRDARVRGCRSCVCQMGGVLSSAPSTHTITQHPTTHDRCMPR